MNDYVTKITSTDTYKVDGRITVSIPSKPQSKNILNGPEDLVVSGVRMNATTWPSGT